MKFFLKNIETQFEDHILEQAEFLLEENRIGRLEEVEKGLWIGEVKAEKAYEFEVQLIGKKVQAYSCDCGQYDATEVCNHLAASFLYLRNYLQKKAASKTEVQRNPKPPKRLTTNVILREISSEALKEFVRTYARDNREFTIALKARFASAVSDMDRQEKYLQLLSTAIKSVKRQNRKINLQGLKKIAQVIEKLQEQAYENIALKNYQEAFAVISGIFEKTPGVLRNAESNKALLLDALENNLTLLGELLEAPPAPALQTTIWEYLLVSFKEAYLKLYGFDQKLLVFLKNRFSSNKQNQRLIQVIDERLKDPLLHAEGRTYLLTNQLDLFIFANEQKKASQLISQYISTPEILLKAIEMARGRKDFKRVIKLSNLGLTLNIPTVVQERLEETLFVHSSLLNRKAATIKWAKKRFLTTYQKEYWTAIKKHSKSDWLSHKKELIALLAAQTFSINQRDALAWIYCSEKDNQALFLFLEETGSLDLLIQYDQKLPISYQDNIRSLYETFLTIYLNQHVGRQTSLKVRKVLDHLQQTGAGDFSLHLAQKFRKEFSERNSLMEELADL